ncbi:MAG: hypothetical protein D6785_04560 [Planctomycetota bacterium]|nr:MAG: hypothetical protein D6785_04560 [Planctomycetota bacterium]
MSKLKIIDIHFIKAFQLMLRGYLYLDHVPLEVEEENENNSGLVRYFVDLSSLLSSGKGGNK